MNRDEKMYLTPSKLAGSIGPDELHPEELQEIDLHPRERLQFPFERFYGRQVTL